MDGLTGISVIELSSILFEGIDVLNQRSIQEKTLKYKRYNKFVYQWLF